MSGTAPAPVPTEPDPTLVGSEAAPPVPDVGSGEGAPIPPDSGAPSSPPEQPPVSPDWRDRRIATLTRRLREIQERGTPAPTPAPTQGTTPAPVPDQAIVEARARELAAIQDFNRRCDDTALTGRAQFGEEAFNGRINNLQKLVDQSDPASVTAYNALLLAAIDTGEGAKVLHSLGADLNEAQRILGMQPTKMAVELTKRAIAPPTETSEAPKPITPIGSRGTPHTAIEPDDPDKADHLSTAEWMRRREKQVSDKIAAERGR